MRTTAVLLAALAALASLATLAAPAAVADHDNCPAPGGHAVDVVNNAFVDSATGTAATRVPAGATVTWTWVEGFHSVTAGLARQAIVPPAFDSGNDEAGAHECATHFSVTFDEPGRHVYHCAIHAGMRGVLVVE